MKRVFWDRYIFAILAALLGVLGICFAITFWEDRNWLALPFAAAGVALIIIYGRDAVICSLDLNKKKQPETYEGSIAKTTTGFINFSLRMKIIAVFWFEIEPSEEDKQAKKKPRYEKFYYYQKKNMPQFEEKQQIGFTYLPHTHIIKELRTESPNQQ